MHRFFVDKNNIEDLTITIKGEDVKHIQNVLRLNEGDVISVCDKLETDYIVKIVSINKERVKCDIIKSFPSTSEPSIEINLYQGLPKSTKMDLIVQKSTEIGVKRIIPVITDRTVVKIQDRKKENKKIERWSRIAEESAKQSKRGIVPEINKIITFDEMLKIIDRDGLIIVPYECEKNVGINTVLKNSNVRNISIIIGPEGGFEEHEIDALKAIGSRIVSLGPRILRTETAGLVTSAIVLYEKGDLGVI